MIPHFCDWLVRRVTVCAAALAVLLVPAIALAQTIAVATTPPKREPGPIGHTKQTSLAGADCRANGQFSYQVTIAGSTGGESLEIWGSTGDCIAREARVGVNKSCWLIRRESGVLNGTRFVPLRAQDIVSRELAVEGEGRGTPASCNQSIGSTLEEKQILYFMLVDSNFDIANNKTAVVTTDLFVDLVGPPPPTEVKAGIGEERIVLSWKGSTARDLAGYNFYCDPPRGPIQTTTMQGDGGPLDDGAVGAGGAPDAAGGAAGVGGSAGSVDDGGDSGPTDGAAGTGIAGAGATDGGTREGGTGNADCPSALVSQTLPEERFFCGSTGPNTNKGEADGLVNYQEYAVGVTAKDTLGNPGLLSEIQCGTPQEVDDFYEVYKRAGGKGGGGFCSLGAEPSYGAGFLFAAAALAHWVRRRRR